MVFVEELDELRNGLFLWAVQLQVSSVVLDEIPSREPVWLMCHQAACLCSVCGRSFTNLRRGIL